MQFTQLEEDKEANCKDYNQDKNQSVVEEIYINQLGCMPPWFSDNDDFFGSKTYNLQNWIKMSDYIFNTMDGTFLDERIIFLPSHN